MRKTISILLLVVVSSLSAATVQVHDTETIWQEFVVLLKSDRLSLDKIRPYRESMGEPLLGFLDTMREKARWAEWEKNPEVHTVGKQIHFLIPLTFDGKTHTYTFSFLLEDDQWYLQHLESISIRLDQVAGLPTSTFPDLPEERKAWIREEIRITELVRLFNFIKKREGRESALQWFKDGAGYALAARSWVPFVPARDAFVLYLCWEQSRLRGNPVVLQELVNQSARVQIEPIYFRLYEQASHLKKQISIVDYFAIFETIWQDRANAAGWLLELECEDGHCQFNFRATEFGNIDVKSRAHVNAPSNLRLKLAAEHSFSSIATYVEWSAAA